jgi:two-component system sensor histidine kinase FlrB
MSAQHSQQIQNLEQTFQIFNRVSERLEASYHRLENQVTQLHGELATASQEQANSDVSADEASRLRAILTALPAGVVVLDASGRVQECNPAAMSLLGEPLQGEVWTQVIHRAFAPRSDDGHEISLKNGRRVSISTCPLAGMPGQVLQISDVTETRELQDHLSQHQRLIAMGEMAAGLAHQIRTPLAAGLLFATQMKNPALDDATRNSIADKVMTQLRQLESLINDMLMYSRSGYSGDEHVEVENLLSDLAAAVSTICQQRNIELEVDGDLAMAVKGNPRILHSALLNLANNAVQAIGHNGTLKLHARAGVCDTVEICVADDGPGVPEEIRDDLFRPFFTTRSDGTGLGLAVVQAVARAHGGSVRLECGSERGSEFIVQLPLVAADSSEAMQHSTAKAMNE